LIMSATFLQANRCQFPKSLVPRPSIFMGASNVLPVALDGWAELRLMNRDFQVAHS